MEIVSLLLQAFILDKYVQATTDFTWIIFKSKRNSYKTYKNLKFDENGIENTTIINFTCFFL